MAKEKGFMMIQMHYIYCYFISINKISLTSDHLALDSETEDSCCRGHDTDEY